MINDYRLDRLTVQMPEEKAHKLQEVIAEYIKLKRENNKNDISFAKSVELEIRINKLLWKWEKLLYEGEI